MPGEGAQHIHVLHVDDDQTFTRVTTKALNRVDPAMSVTSAHTADAALERLESDSFDCVVADYEMPEMNGLDLLYAVSDAHPDLPFILFTGKGSEDVASDAISAGVTDYIQKATGDDQFAVLANRIRNAVESARAQVALRRSRDRLEAMTDAFPDVAFLIDETGRYRDVLAGPDSPTLYDERQSFVDNRFSDIFPEPIAETFLDTVHETLTSGQTKTLEYELQVESGTKVFEARVAPLRTTLDGKRGVLWVAREITEHRESAAALRRKNNRLQEFAGMVSHDLRNPLNVAKSHLDLARESDDGEHHLDFVADAHDRMEALVSDMLTLARESEGVEETAIVGLPAVAERCWRNVDTIDAKLTVADDDYIECDPRRLQRLLENLFRNAVEHAGGEATVEVGILEDGSGFYVEDDGPGFPADQRDVIHQRGVSTKDDGTGFGLAIVENIATAHSWDVELATADSGGARVELHSVPIVEERDPDDRRRDHTRGATGANATAPAESSTGSSPAGE